MALQSDLSVGFKKESTYGTGVVVDRWLEFLPDESLDYRFNVINGKGLKVGQAGVARSTRRVRTTSAGSGDVDFELVTKGMGTLFEALMGTGASTSVSGTTYQQNFTFGALPSVTIQKGLVLADSGGTRDQYTFQGCTATGFEINLPMADYATVKSSWDVRAFDTTTAYATPSYAVASGYHWGIAAVTVGGTVTAPTTTALATGGTAVTNVKAMNIKVDNALSGEDYRIGAAGLKAKPFAGIRTITGSIEVAHDSTTMRAAYAADTALPITLTLTSAEALSAGFATFQVTLPECRLNGPLPKSNNGQIISVTYEFEAYDNQVAAQPMYVCFRTADTAL